MGDGDSLDAWRFDDEMMETIDKIRHAFQESNVTKDGKLNEAQLADLFVRLNKGLTEDHAAKLFAQIDKDKSGYIDIEEFLWYVFDLDEAMEISLKHKEGLHPARVYARVRPMATEGGHAAGEEVHMKLDGWSESSIKVVNKHEDLNFTFPRLVIGPEKTQDQVFDETMLPLMDDWLAKCYNVQLLAYGQSGTGKTHTMFGTRESMGKNDPDPDWGIFPRVVHHALKLLVNITKVFTTTKWTLTASAVEFYMTQAFDLIGDHSLVLLDEQGMPIGLKQIRITSVSDLVPFLDKVNATRTMSKTKMNAGSSRSHCALILTLHQCDHKMNKYVNTTFTVVDMAGSERTTKTGAEFLAPSMITSMVSSGKKLTKEQQMGAEGGLINYELTLFATEVQTATEQHQKKKRYVKPNRVLSTDTIRFLGRSLDGYCILAMMVCISQAPQNGWETWFSCTYGERLAKLQAPLKKMKLKDMDKELPAAKKAAAKAKKAFEETPKTGSAASKYYEPRKAAAMAAQEYVDILQELTAPP